MRPKVQEKNYATNAQGVGDRTIVSRWIKGMYLCNMKRVDHGDWCTDTAWITNGHGCDYLNQIGENAMQRQGLTLGTYKNIRIGLDYSWFVMFVLVVFMLARYFFPQNYEDMAALEAWSLSVLTALLFFLSILLHEFAHALAARNRNVEISEIILFIFGGLAKMKKEPERARDEFVIAGAGPLCSFILGLLFLGLSFLLEPFIREGLHGVFWYIGYINILLVIFNLVPGFPLDGGRMLRAAIWHYSGNLRKSTRIVSNMGQIFAFVLMFVGVLVIFGGGLIVGIVWIFVGMFLLQSAKSGYYMVAMREGLSGIPVGKIMTTNPSTVHPNVSLKNLVDEYFFKNRFSCFPVMRNDEFVGLVEINQVKAVDRDQWEFTRVSDVMTPRDALRTVKPDTDAYDVLMQMIDAGSGRLPVLENGELVGIISRKDIMQFVEFREALGT
ncbi:MAG: site-2 protease family protein [Balneolaceae bacterium]|nr:MAG: site-2 protease family protein [Balneolaceae bacterium]